MYAYGGYERQCLGLGEVHPISGTCHEWLVPHMGLTIIDSMDTMLIMGLNDEYIRGRDYLRKNLHWDLDASPSLFETNIRFLGGLLSAYDFTKDPFLLAKAKELAERLKPAFKTPTGLPKSYVNLQTYTPPPSLSLFLLLTLRLVALYLSRKAQTRGVTKSIDWAPDGASLLAEVGTTQLEWAFLSALTDDSSYAKTVRRSFASVQMFN